MAARVLCSCGWAKTYPTRAKAEANARRHVCSKTTGVRRATRKFRCARCGLKAVYENAGAAEARSWFNRHSCRKREDAMVRAAQAAARQALIDRTPQPCRHKQANHQHGTNAAYILDRCRCEPCAKAHAAQEQWRHRQKAYGRYHKYVNAEHVRAHLRELADYGIGLKQVAKLSGVSTGTLSKLMFGVYPSTGTGGGRNGPGIKVREPSRRVLRSTAEKVYAVEAIPANLGAGQKDHDRTPTARLHLRALVALGWSQSKLATHLGILPTNLGPIIGTHGPNVDRVLSRATVDKIEALFAELCMTLPPETTQRDLIAAARARNYAQARGWLPPLALDDDGDELTPIEDVDPVVVSRILDGDPAPAAAASPAERRAVVAAWPSTGRSLNDLARLTGWKPERYQTPAAATSTPAAAGHHPSPTNQSGDTAA